MRAISCSIIELVEFSLRSTPSHGQGQQLQMDKGQKSGRVYLNPSTLLPFVQQKKLGYSHENINYFSYEQLA